MKKMVQKKAKKCKSSCSSKAKSTGKAAKDKKIVGGNTKFKAQVSQSSREYLLRQAKDPFVQKAIKEGFRSRAAYKLLEIAEKHELLKRGNVVVDLGAAPGGWSQLISRTMGDTGKIFALDILEMEPIANVKFLQGDFTEEEVEQDFLKMCPEKVDVVLSDMAPNTTGNADLDHLRSMGLAELAEDFALKTLRKDGVFLCKLFQGGEETEMRDRLRKHFTKVGFEKPEASRGDSREIFILARGFKG